MSPARTVGWLMDESALGTPISQRRFKLADRRRRALRLSLELASARSARQPVHPPEADMAAGLTNGPLDPGVANRDRLLVLAIWASEPTSSREQFGASLASKVEIPCQILA